MLGTRGRPWPALPLPTHYTLPYTSAISRNTAASRSRNSSPRIRHRQFPLATDAVKQWIYRPTMLNGVPVETQTNIQLNFKGN